jgi:hypothetical protein
LTIFAIPARIAAAAALCAVAISFAGAQVRTDYSGTWILDVARSDSSTFTPRTATWTVVQRGDSIILDRTTSGNVPQHAVYALDGMPRTSTLHLIGVSSDATSTVSWSGAVMVVRTTSRPGDDDLVQTDSWTLSPGGKELRVKRQAVYGGAAMGSPTFVFVKQ